MLSPVLLALALALVTLATIPTRRLFLAGWRAGSLATYLAALVALGFAVALGIGPLRVTVPVLVVVAAAPYVGPRLRDWARRTLLRRDGPWRPPGRRRPPKIVGSGPGRTVAPGDPGSGEDR